MHLFPPQVLKAVSESAGTYFFKIISALLVLLAAALVIRILLGLVRRSLKVAGVEPTLVKLLVGGLRLAAWAFALSAILNVLGFHQVSLGVAVATALLGAALATGAAGVVSDVLGGLLLAADPAFSIGRRVNAAGVEGTVKEINLRKTILEDAEGNIHVLPNRTVDSSPYVLRLDKPAVGGQPHLPSSGVTGREGMV